MSHPQHHAVVRSSSTASASAVGSSTSSSSSTIPPPSLLRYGSSSLTSSLMTSSLSSSTSTSSSSSIREKPPSLLGSLSGGIASVSSGGGGVMVGTTSALSSGLSPPSSATTGSSENLPPRTLARVARDVRDLVRSPPEGVRLVLDGETGMPGSLSEIMAEIEGPEQTPYHTRYFQLKLVLSADFPSTPPRGYFLTKIYHPNVDPTTGAICVNTLKSDWTPSTTIGHILTVIRCLLIVPFPESSLNDEAGRNFMDSYDEYARRARLLAGVHGLTGWSSGGGGGGRGTSSPGSGGGGAIDKATEATESGGEEDYEDDLDDHKKKATANPAESRKTVNCSSIVRAGSKTLDKKNKKKSLRRL
ncbi:hypothetical protein ACHAXA_009880 [Cyclostephanos tholiformis]|uniref:E2 ubiquitin-conjugating enzyme n=1 Tax=Cyclostephanos tholiformis TaxID=382380 RepID=A0ABD3R4J9_9STRA